MSGYTPGPWEPMVGSYGLVRGIRGRNWPESVNVVNWNGISRASSEVGQANAALMLASPDLLEALSALIEVMSAGGMYDDEVFAQGRAAIAKATP